MHQVIGITDAIELIYDRIKTAAFGKKKREMSQLIHQIHNVRM